jgi:hypothetical protein
VLNVKRFGGGMSELVYKLKELETENARLRELKLAPVKLTAKYQNSLV